MAVNSTDLAQRPLPAVERLKLRAAQLADKSKAETTKRNYRIAWADFTWWCEDNHLISLPALPETIAAYLTRCAENLSVSTIEQRLAAIAYYHTINQQPDPTHDNRVRELLKGIRRDLGTEPHGKAAIRRDDLTKMVSYLRHRATPKPGDELRNLRDSTMLLLGFSGAFRRSEITARFNRDESLDVADLLFLEDGLTVKLRRSKTDQEGRSKTKFIPHLSHKKMCAACALQLWLKQAEIASGPVFRPIDRWGHVGKRPLTAEWLAHIIKEAAPAAGLDPREVGGHSLRAGFVTQAFEDEVPAEDIIEVTQHDLLQTLLGYNRGHKTGQRRTITRVLEG